MKLFFTSFFLCIFLISCKNDDLEATIPAFLTIEKVDLKVRNDEGTAISRITDVKVFVNDQSLGSFELPTTVPIQQTGNINIKVRAGIFNNGQSNNREDYPFFTTYSLDTILSPEEKITLIPQVEYFENAIIGEPWSGEDFESGVNFERAPSSDTIFIRGSDPNETLEGAYGLAFLESDQDFFEARTPTFSNIPRDGRPVYLEFNYKSTHDITVGVYTNDQSVQSRIVSFRSRTSWTKVYVKLGTVFSTLARADNFNLSFGYTKPIGEEGKLFVDNFKLVRF